tara:strand:+ start:163571 stop:163978 length:408 start_codon:yes stop_codon:yes gene_type:complete
MRNAVAANAASTGPLRFQQHWRNLVTVDSLPIEGEVITFLTQVGTGRSSSAVNDSEGCYFVDILPAKPGVLPGAYVDVISRLEMPDRSPVHPGAAPMDVGAAERFPDQFSSFAPPSLTAEAGSGGGEFHFDLKTT